MRNHITLLILSLFLFIATGVALSCSRGNATGEPDATAAIEAGAPEAGVAILEPAPQPQPPASDALAQYVHDSMQKWKPSKDDVFYMSVANDIAVVVLSESPLFKQDDSRGRTAILLAAVAFYEGGLARWVDDGTCGNVAAMKAKRVGWPGACDGGLAVSLWQIHNDYGFVLADNGGWRWAHSAEMGITSADLLQRQVAARVALHIMRQSINAGAGLCQFSGEEGPCPKAKARLDFAMAWSARHPF